jgi:hypothetical protein
MKAGRTLNGGALALLAFAVLVLPDMALAQGTPARSETDVREHLIWNSPWEGRASPPQLYSFRTVFRKRRDALIAETISYATNQRSTSVVTLQDGRIAWQDSNGADVNVAVATTGDLEGTAISRENTLQIVFKPRP